MRAGPSVAVHPHAPQGAHQLRGSRPFIVTGVLFGILYNTLFYPRTPVEYLEASTIGVLLGAVVGWVEQQASLRRWLQRRSFISAV